jgi:hypothetical protein
MQAIIVQSFIAAPPDTVWAALRSRTDVLFDGLPAGSWPEGGSEEPPYHVEVPWPFTAAAGGATKVSLTLHDAGDGVRVDLRHEGWGEGSAWDTAIQGHFAGWLQGLAAIGLLLETGRDARVREPSLPGRERYFISGEIPAAPPAVYRSITDEAVRARWSGGVLDGAEVVEELEDRFVRWRVGAQMSGRVNAQATGRLGEITAILRATPRGTHLAVAEYGVADRGASGRWPAMFEGLARFLQ